MSTTPAPFVRRRLEDTEERISPVLETPAIREMQCTLEGLFSGQRRAGTKPRAITCFDTSGSGKTETVAEAARLAGASRIVLSAVFSPALTGALRSCRRHPFPQSPGGLVQGHEVEETFQDKFHATLTTMFEWMAELLSHTPAHELVDADVDEGEYKTPPPSLEDVTMATSKDCQSAFRALKESLGKDRKLVLHVDDCQYFLSGVLLSPAHRQDAIPAGEVMALALRAFSSCIAPFAARPNIVWVFTGTRPTLLEDISLTSGLQAADISDLMTDFGTDEVSTLLGHYFRFEDATLAEKAQLAVLCGHLAGPPKNVQFFLQAASKFLSLTSSTALIQQWDAIEARATRHFHRLVASTYRFGDLDLTARNLVLLHTRALLTSHSGGTEEFVVPSISRHLISLVEAGLLRVRQVEEGWKVFPPNRLLVRLLRKHVRWYTWENLEQLRSLVHNMPVMRTLSGKVFEYLFALELCDSAQGKLWTFLQEQAGLRPLYANRNPSIHLVAGTDTCWDPSHIHVISDPDHSGSKWDVQFIAIDIHTNKNVRVLAQLTLAECGVSKMTASFDGMLALSGVVMDGEAEELLDHRLFIAPKCKVALEGDGVYQQQYASNRCRAFPKSARLSEAFEFPLDLMCNSGDPDAAIRRLVAKAEAMGDGRLAGRIAGDPHQAVTSFSIDHASSMPMDIDASGSSVSEEAGSNLRKEARDLGMLGAGMPGSADQRPVSASGQRGSNASLAMPITMRIKVHYQEEIFTFSLPYSQPTLAELHARTTAKMRLLVPDTPTGGKWRLKYVDEQGDHISMLSDTDVEEALEVGRIAGVLHIHVR